LFKTIFLLCNVDVLAGATETLIQELETRFPTHGVMDAFGIVYPQYWSHADYETSFPKHLAIIKTILCSNKT
jgi:hypothetical protein